MIEETSPLPRDVRWNASSAVLWLIIGVAFLPYIPAGYRTEHVLAPLIAFNAFCFLINRQLGILRWLLVPLLALTIGVTAAMLGSIISYKTGTQASPINMFVRLAMPPLLLVTFIYLIEKHNIAFHSIVEAIFFSSIVIGVISLLSVSSFYSEFLHPFVAKDGVWRGSRGTGRYPGIFNQPIEAGLYFGLASLCLAYVYKISKVPTLLLVVGLLAILLGGSVSLSKTFFLGLAVVILFLAALKKWRIVATIAIGSVPAILVAYYVLDPTGAYFNSLVSLLHENGPVAAITAGRFGMAESGGNEMARQLLEAASNSRRHLVLGFGLGSFMPLDSGFFEYAYQGGMVALFGYLSFFAFFFWLSFEHRASEYGKLLFFVTFFVLVASFGGPTLTANRAGFLVLLLFAGAVVEARRRSSPVWRHSAVEN